MDAGWGNHQSSLGIGLTLVAAAGLTSCFRKMSWIKILSVILISVERAANLF
jgi:hypothetical protein